MDCYSFYIDWLSEKFLERTKFETLTQNQKMAPIWGKGRDIHIKCTKQFKWNLYFYVSGKEYIERRHGEPFKFLFLPKMGLLGSQAVLEKNVQFWIMSNFLAPFFQLFMGKILFFWNFFYIVASALKRCLIRK
jgi:hypothetical protein